MSHNCQPQLDPVPIGNLRPTQMTVGMREVLSAKFTRDVDIAEGSNPYLVTLS